MIKQIFFKKWFIYVCLLFFLPLTGLEEIYNNLLWIPLIRIACCFISILVYIKRRNVSILMFIITFFCLVLNISTTFNQGYYFGAFYGQLFLILGICCFFEVQIKKDKNQFLLCLYQYCYLTIILNFASILIFPQGLYADIRGITETNYLLGNYNSFICKILPALCVGYHLLQENIIKIKNYLLLWLIVMITYIYVSSITSIIGIAIFGIFLLLFNNKISRIIYNSIFYSGSALYLAYYLVFRHAGITFLFITRITGKSITLSGRTVLWDKMVSLLSKSPILGFGVYKNIDLIEYFGLDYAGHAHNLLLQVLFQTGIVGCLLWVILILITINTLLKTSFNKIARSYGCALFSLLIMLSTDFYGYAIIFQMFLLINFCCREIYKDSKNAVCLTR